MGGWLPKFAWAIHNMYNKINNPSNDVFPLFIYNLIVDNHNSFIVIQLLISMIQGK